MYRKHLDGDVAIELEITVISALRRPMWVGSTRSLQGAPFAQLLHRAVPNLPHRLILALLKSSTAVDHRRVESAMPSLPELARPEGYAWSLRAMHRFFLAWEAPLFDALACADDRLTLAERGKVALLSADLAALRLSPLTVPCSMPGDVVASAATALGAMYVLEGSTLGGRVIERHCAGPLGVSPAHGGAFYHGYGARTGTLWQTFGAVLESHDTDAQQRAAMLHGARSCFGALRGFLESIPATFHAHDAARRHD